MNESLLSRRHLLKAGALGLGGLALRAAPESAGKSVIFVLLAGGPSHLETYDPKPDAAIEIRGPMGTIPTSLPGVRFCEFIPEQAKIAHRLGIVRSLRHTQSQHHNGEHIVHTGHPMLKDNNNDLAPSEMPSLGAHLSKQLGPRRRGLLPYVALTRATRHEGPNFLGPAYAPFETHGYPNSDGFKVDSLGTSAGFPVRRMEQRLELLKQLEPDANVIDRNGQARVMDRFREQARELIGSGRAQEAFNIHAENPRLRARYGRNHFGQSLLLARRLAEAGVPFTTVTDSGWDHHANLVSSMREMTPRVDQGIAALVADLYERGLDKDVLLVVTGEFGRTPRFNALGGRDHWPGAYTVVFSGGGLKVGQVVGSTTADGAEPATDPYGPQDVLAMVCRHLGVDWTTTVEDGLGRPVPILDRARTIRELI